MYRYCLNTFHPLAMNFLLRTGVGYYIEGKQTERRRSPGTTRERWLIINAVDTQTSQELLCRRGLPPEQYEVIAEALADARIMAHKGDVVCVYVRVWSKQWRLFILAGIYNRQFE